MYNSIDFQLQERKVCLKKIHLAILFCKWAKNAQKTMISLKMTFCKTFYFKLCDWNLKTSISLLFGFEF